MILYEVNLRIERGIARDYIAWLRVHVAQMLALPGFTGAELFDVDDAPDAATHVSLCAQYRLHDRDALDTYLRDHAPRMRADGVVLFGDRFAASRRVLRPLSDPS